MEEYFSRPDSLPDVMPVLQALKAAHIIFINCSSSRQYGFLLL